MKNNVNFSGSEKLGEAGSLAPPSPLSLPGHCNPAPPHLSAEFSAKPRCRSDIFGSFLTHICFRNCGAYGGEEKLVTVL